MNLTKKIGLVVLILLIGIQLIQPARNSSGQVPATDISKTVFIPGSVQSLLQTACNDCHSNNTNYPWYANVQPLGFWLQNHVNEGKEHLNFSEFGKLSPKEQAHAFEEMAEEVEEDHMPLDSYLWIHKEAQLTAQEKQTLISWATTLHEQAKQQQ